MPSRLPKLTIIFALLLPMLTWADFGDRPVDWSTNESADFRDFAVRSFSKQDRLVNNFWAMHWLSQKILELNLINNASIGTTTPLILNDKSVNAFAVPGNLIGTHLGLWHLAENESEFLSVLAHEISHISLDHFSRLSENSNNQGLLLASGILLSLLISSEAPEVANAALFSAFAVANQQQLNFSQAMELEADQRAQFILANAGLDPNSGRVFFQKLEQESFRNDSLEFLRSHPLGTTRASRLSSANPVDVGETVGNLAYQLIRHFLLNPDQPPKQFEGWTELPKTVTDPNVKYAWILNQFHLDQDREVFIDQLDGLINQHRGFLPAQFERLRQESNITNGHSSQLCRLHEQLSYSVEASGLTLDAIETLKVSANKCDTADRMEWQAMWMWYQGKEEGAIRLLASTIENSSNTNDTARNRTLLELLNQRIQRFP